MRSRVFEFVATNTTNLIKKISIIGNVWTLYSKQTNAEPPEGEFDAAMQITQANSKCQGQPYQIIHGDDVYHESFGLHDNDPDANQMHFHRLAACLDKKTGLVVGEKLITLAEVEHIMNQLKIIQRNKTHMKQLHNDPSYLEYLTEAFGRPVKIPPYKPADFISQNDTEALRKSYRQFYANNKAHYAEKIKYADTTALKSPRKPRAVTTMAISAGMAASIVCLRDAMIYNGVSKKRADQIIDFLLIAFIAKFSDSFTLALVAAATHIVLKNMPEFEGSSMLKNLAAIIVYAVNSESPFSASSAIKYAATALTAFYSTNLTRAINHTLFGAYPAEAVPQQYYAGLRPGFLNQ
jgi:hypothetical protein